jgi:Transmembrane family 220, helix
MRAFAHDRDATNGHRNQLRPGDQAMRALNGCSCVMLAGFALVQYNDPDAILWFLIYATPAAWAGLAAFRPQRLAPSPRLVGAYAACLAAALTGSLWCWPALPPDWITIETEREGLGIIIATLALALVGLSWWRRARHWQAALP